MKKFVLLSATLLLAMSMIYAGGAAERTAAPPAPVVSYEVTEPITIEWWHALEQQYWPLVDEVVGGFNNTHPLITVEAKHLCRIR